MHENLKCKKCDSVVHEPGQKFCSSCGTSLQDTEAQEADLGERAIAFFIDCAIIGTVVQLITSGLPEGHGLLTPMLHADIPFSKTAFTPLFGIIMILYHGLCEGSELQATPGKSMMGLKVLSRSRWIQDLVDLKV